MKKTQNFKGKSQEELQGELVVRERALQEGLAAGVKGHARQKLAKRVNTIKHWMK